MRLIRPLSAETHCSQESPVAFLPTAQEDSEASAFNIPISGRLPNLLASSHGTLFTLSMIRVPVVLLYGDPSVADDRCSHPRTGGLAKKFGPPLGEIIAGVAVTKKLFLTKRNAIGGFVAGFENKEAQREWG